MSRFGITVFTACAFLFAPVQDAHVAERMAPSKMVVGRIVATQGGGIASSIAAVVSDVTVIAGDRVAAGETLAILNVDDRSADLRSARAGIAVAEARRGVAEAAEAAERATYDRLIKLKDSAAFNAARFEDSYKEVLRLRALLAVEQAGIEQAKAEAARIVVDIERARVVAPYDAIVTSREIDKGDFVTVGRRMFTLLNTTALEVEVDVPTAAAAALRPGIRLNGASREGVSVPVEVRAVLPVENALTRTRTVRLRVVDNATGLAVGQALEVTLPTGVE